MKRWLVLLIYAWLGLLPLSLQAQYRHGPPADPVRVAAEWEEVEYVLLTWTQYIPTLCEVVRYAREECEVLIVCLDSMEAKADLQQRGIPLSGVYFLEKPFNSIWMRDYGPTTVYFHDVGRRLLVDWIYNRPRPEDDYLPVYLARKLGLPLWRMSTAPYDLVHIGGNFLTDGQGLALSSRLVVEENRRSGYLQSAKDEPGLDSLVGRYLGIDRFVKLTPLPYDHIHHLDMHMQLLDEETLLVGQYPPGVADGPQIEANLRYLLDSVQTAFGTPFKVLRVPMPDFRGRYPDSATAPYLTHTNLVFINRTVLVPVYGGPSDSVALRLLRRQLPGYRIVGIDCSEVIQAGGALRCITRTVGVKAPLRIVHQPLRTKMVTGFPLEVKAQIQHQSGIAKATIYYRTAADTAYRPIPMMPVDRAGQQWSGYLPAMQASAGPIRYYIEAQAQDGKTLTRPLTAPAGYWQFELEQQLSLGMREEF